MKTEKERKYQREWMKKKRASDPNFREIERKNAREYQKKNPVKNAVNNYKTTARKKNLNFKISVEDIERLVMGNCNYCGSPPNPINGIDRVNNRIGYILKNCVSCCAICNYAKHTLTIKEFKSWVNRVYNYLKLKN